MPTNWFTLLVLIVPLLWNFMTVFYFIKQARKGELSPIKFSTVFSLGFSITISVIIFVALSFTKGISRNTIGFTLFVFLFNFVIGLPVVYYLSRTLLTKQFSKWSSQIIQTRINK